VFFPPIANIIILVDASNGLNESQFKREKEFIANQLVTNNWTHFERIAVVVYGSVNQNRSNEFGSINSYKEFQQLLINQTQYSGTDSTPSLATYQLKLLNNIFCI
jgi:hypothetical protein